MPVPIGASRRQGPPIPPFDSSKMRGLRAVAATDRQIWARPVGQLTLEAQYTTIPAMRQARKRRHSQGPKGSSNCSICSRRQCSAKSGSASNVRRESESAARGPHRRPGRAAEWAAFHHERLDGNGYPFHHHGKDLTLGSRIMAVADVFTAITEDRPYRKGMTRGEAQGVLDKLVNNGGLDGDVLAVLRRDFEVINALREKEQVEYARQQERLVEYLQYPRELLALTA